MDSKSLKEIRTIKKLSQEKVGIAMGATQSFCSKLERNDINNLSSKSLKRYAKALGGKLKVSIVFDDEEIEVGI